MHLTADLTDDDQRRATRLLLAWIDGDRLAFDAVLGEAMAHDTGVPGLLFGVTAFGADLAEEVAPDAADQLRQSLLTAAAEGDDSRPTT